MHYIKGNYCKKVRILLKYGVILAVFILLILTITFKFKSNSTSIVCNNSQKISIEVLEKELVTSHGIDFLFLKLKFINNTKKAINNVSGNITFFDLSDDQMYSVDLGYPRFPRTKIPAEAIAINSSEEQNYPISYFEYVEELFWLNNTPLKHLKCEWNTHEIIYEDGTQESSL